MLQLKDKYFTIVSKKIENDTYVYNIRLNADHEIYKGHFPGNPISPGVCSIQTIRECCEDALSMRLTIRSIKLCRFANLLTPSNEHNLFLKINISLENKEYTIAASIIEGETTFVNFKGSFEQQK